MDYSELNQYLLSRAREIIPQWLPGGKVQGREFQVGDLTGAPGRSLSVNLDTGKWADFAADIKGGDLVSLYAAIHSLDQSKAKEAMCKEHLLNGYGGKAHPVTQNTPVAFAPEPAPIDSVPTMHHYKWGAPSVSWVYRSETGKVLSYIARYDFQGAKQFCPWTYSQGKWVAKAIPSNRPLYNLDQITSKPDKPVLICEGEKATDAAKAIVGPHYVCTTWQSGAKAITKTDWQPLKDRSILIWPDADQPGKEAAYGIASILHGIGVKEIKVLDVSDQADGWDAADSTFNWESFKAWAKPRAAVVKPAATPIPIPAAEILPNPNTFNAEACRSILPHLSTKLKPLGTYENYKAMCAFAGVTVRYDVVKKRTEIIIPGHSFSYGNSHVYGPVVLTSWAVQIGLSTTNLYDYLGRMAEENQYNPVSTWIESQPWDGIDRLDDLYATITVKPRHEGLKQTLMKRWLVSAVASAFRPDGFASQGVLVFQGNQGLGKTRWFKRLVPHELDLVADGRSLNPHDKDSVLGSVQYWLVELAELDATFRKADIAALKAFLTRDFDVIRKPYARGESHMPRKTVFFASVNPKEFLSDETGNRRYWTIPCVDINYEHDINMQQLWAQVLELYKQNEQHWLTPEELSSLNENNSESEQIDPIFEAIEELPWQSPTTLWRPMTTVEVLKLVGYDRPGMIESKRCAAALRKLGAQQTANARSGAVRFLVPTLPQYGA